MDIDRNEHTGFLTFVLTSELSLGDRWLDFIADLKDQIPPDGRSYDPQTHEWTIARDHWEAFAFLRKQYFTDPNQEELPL